MKILYITTVSSTMNAFFKPHIKMLFNEGHQVDLAYNESDLPIDDFYKKLGCKLNNIDFSRSPFSFDNVKAYKQLKKVIENGNYDIVHCHTPTASVVTRLVCRKLRKKTGLKVFYTAHGFHFFKGAPKLNWLIFYPIEKVCSCFTDKIITINKEDYQLAKTKFRVKEVCYIPGVGVDFSRFENVQTDRKAKRQEIGVPEDSVLLLSVGELNDNKNHQVIIKALAKLNNSDVHYAIAGMGDNGDYLMELADTLGIKKQVHLLGFRKDIPQLNYSADVFCFPSKREGLGLASIEAMSCGLPLLTSDVHGINDYSIEGKTGYKCSPLDDTGFAEKLSNLIDNEKERKRIAEYNKEFAKQYDVSLIVEKIKQLYD